MPAGLEQRMDPATRRQQPPPAVPVPATTPGERAARHALLGQIERLEGELCSVSISTWPRKGLELSVPAGGGGPRLLSLGGLEELRDDLARRVHGARQSLEERTDLEERRRSRLEQMLLEPEKHKWMRIGNEDIGEPGCRHWHVRPRWGLLGMLMNWWRVRISSGCPLGRGRRGPR